MVVDFESDLLNAISREEEEEEEEEAEESVGLRFFYHSIVREMGRKSKGRGGGGGRGGGIRGMMRGLKNRWGRFQCPRDGSICKSLEAWHWHRHKYHQTEHIDYIELNDDSQPATSQPTTTTSLASSHPHPHPSSPRLLPPEAFAPRRPEILFPDDASDLTEPEIPVLLLEEVTSREEVTPPGGGPEVMRWEESDESSSVADEEHVSQIHQEATTLLQDHPRDASAARLHGCDSHGNQESRMTRDSRSEERLRDSRSLQPPSHEKIARHHSNDSHGNQCQRRERSCSHERSVDHSVPQPPHRPATSSCPTASSSVLDLVALFVLSLLQSDEGERSAPEILREAESRFAGQGLSGEGLEGVVTGALVAFKGQWTKAYNAGWKDGATEVLNAPLLRAMAPPLLHHSPGAAATSTNSVHTTDQVTLLTTPPGQRAMDEKEGPLASKINCRGNSIETLETSAERTRNFSTDHLDNDPNNNDAIVMTEN